MNRLHINIRVEDLEHARKQYQALLGSEPTFSRSDYIKWDLDDPAINLSVMARGGKNGLDHLGIRYDDEVDYIKAVTRISALDEVMKPEPDANCCYAHSDKTWWNDGVDTKWELFVTHNQTEHFGASDDDETIEMDNPVSEQDSVRSTACC